MNHYELACKYAKFNPPPPLISNYCLVTDSRLPEQSIHNRNDYFISPVIVASDKKSASVTSSLLRSSSKHLQKNAYDQSKFKIEHRASMETNDKNADNTKEIFLGCPNQCQLSMSCSKSLKHVGNQLKENLSNPFPREDTLLKLPYIVNGSVHFRHRKTKFTNYQLWIMQNHFSNISRRVSPHQLEIICNQTRLDKRVVQVVYIKVNNEIIIVSSQIGTFFYVIYLKTYLIFLPL